MPPSDNTNEKGWIRGDQLVLPRQTLSSEEIGPFLKFLFGKIARKPKHLKLKETAGVARYLKAAAVEAEASSERGTIERLAEVIWLTMLDSGQIEIAPKEEAIQFLKTHALTYLASFDINRISEYLENLPEPARHAEFFQPPKLKGASRSAWGQGPARLQDDLTERIYVAYHALRRTGIRNARGRIATVLNGMAGVRSVTQCKWGPAEVHERVRQFGDRIVRRHTLTKGYRRHQERLRNTLVDSWIHGFHSAAPAKQQCDRVPTGID